MNNTPERIAIFGGAFNPPTIGHTQVLTQVLEETSVDKIILSPDGHRLDKDYGISIKDKIEISNIFAQSLRQKGLNVEMDTHFLEGKNNGPTTTVAVDKYFREKYWDDIWHIFGSDVAQWMQNWEWNTNQYIEKKLQKIFLWRPGYQLNANEYGIENYEYLDSKFLEDISSTMVREMVKQKRQEVTDIIGAAQILNYIQQQNLYT